MVLYVRLVKEVDAVAVADFIPALVIGVVAGADGVEVVGLERLCIPNHLLGRQCLGCLLVVLVPVHAVDVDGLPVQKQLPALHLHAPEADGERAALDVPPPFVRIPLGQGDRDDVELGMLR